MRLPGQTVNLLYIDNALARANCKSALYRQLPLPGQTSRVFAPMQSVIRFPLFANPRSAVTSGAPPTPRGFLGGFLGGPTLRGPYPIGGPTLRGVRLGEISPRRGEIAPLRGAFIDPPAGGYAESIRTIY